MAEMASKNWEAKLDALVQSSGIPVKYDARPRREHYSRGVIHMSPKPRNADAKAEWAHVLLKEMARAQIRREK